MQWFRSLVRTMLQFLFLILIKALLMAFLWNWLMLAISKGSYLEALGVVLLGLTLSIAMLAWAGLKVIALLARGAIRAVGLAPGHRSSWLAAAAAFAATEAAAQFVRRNERNGADERRHLR